MGFPPTRSKRVVYPVPPRERYMVQLPRFELGCPLTGNGGYSPAQSASLPQLREILSFNFSTKHSCPRFVDLVQCGQHVGICQPVVADQRAVKFLGYKPGHCGTS